MSLAHVITIFAALLATVFASECSGTYNITTKDDLKAFSDCTELKGRLLLNGLNLDAITLPKLESITAPESAVALDVAHNLHATEISLPNLERIDGAVMIYDNTHLQSLTIGVKSLSGGFLVTANDLSAKSAQGSTHLSLNMDQLEQVDGRMELYSIGQLNMTALKTLKGDLSIQQTTVKEVVLGNLESARTIIIDSNPALEVIRMPRLARVEGNLHIASNPEWKGFETDDLGALKVIEGSLVIADPPRNITKLNMNGLNTIRGGLMVRGSESQLSCGGLKSAFKSSGIVKGKFSCQLDGQSIDSGAVATRLLYQLLTAILLAMTISLFYY